VRSATFVVFPVPCDSVWESHVVNVASHQQRMHSSEKLQTAAAAVSGACLLIYAQGQVTKLALRRDLGFTRFPRHRGVWHKDGLGHCVLVFAGFESGMQSSAESSSTRYAWWLGNNIVRSACMVCMIAHGQSAISLLERMHLALVRGAAQ
jgi:hypothetical protein